MLTCIGISCNLSIKMFGRIVVLNCDGKVKKQRIINADSKHLAFAEMANCS